MVLCPHPSKTLCFYFPPLGPCAGASASTFESRDNRQPRAVTTAIIYAFNALLSMLWSKAIDKSTMDDDDEVVE